MKPYIASAERRVKIHMSISKFKPRWARDRFLDFEDMLTSQRSVKDDVYGKAVKRQEDGPFHPDGFALMFDQPRP
jgi:hypothetical protein